MLLSIIIPTRNRAKYLVNALESITKQTYSKDEFEILVIDNCSTDNTKEIVQSFQSKSENLDYFFEPTLGLHAGRHRGLRESNADILVYGDDDIEAFPTWLEGIAESFEDPDVVLVGGNNLPKYESSPPAWVDDLWSYTLWGKANIAFSLLDFGERIKEISPYYVWGCNFAIRKSILLEVGGFHPDGMPEELLIYRGDGETAVSDMISGKNYKTLFNPKASVYHRVPNSRMTEEYIFKRGYIQGISNSYTDIRKGRKVASRCSEYKLLYSKLALKIGLKKHGKKNIFADGYNKGYYYHQREVRKRKELLDWILKPNYF